MGTCVLHCMVSNPQVALIVCVIIVFMTSAFPPREVFAGFSWKRRSSQRQSDPGGEILPVSKLLTCKVVSHLLTPHGSCGDLSRVHHPDVAPWCRLCRYRSVQTQILHLPFGTGEETVQTPLCPHSRCCATVRDSLRCQPQHTGFGNWLRRWNEGSVTPGWGHLPMPQRLLVLGKGC